MSFGSNTVLLILLLANLFIYRSRGDSHDHTGGRPRYTAPIAGPVTGPIAGVFLLVLVIATVFYIIVRIQRAKSQYARATTRHVTRTSHGITTTGGNIPLSTRPSPSPLTTAFNLPRQPQPQSAPKLTFTQPSNPSITEAPPPAYYLHKTFVNCNENKKPSDDPPSYHPPSYDVATEEAKS